MTMREGQAVLKFKEYARDESLPERDRDLLRAARDACAQAYAPYSRFLVGCALRTKDGKTVTGANQENGAFPIGQCAERVTLYTLVNLHGRLSIDTVAIAVQHPDQLRPAAPCGACRQLLAEYRAGQTEPMRILLTLSPGGPVIEVRDVMELLPLAFDPAVLNNPGGDAAP